MQNIVLLTDGGSGALGRDSPWLGYLVPVGWETALKPGLANTLTVHAEVGADKGHKEGGPTVGGSRTYGRCAQPALAPYTPQLHSGTLHPLTLVPHAPTPPPHPPIHSLQDPVDGTKNKLLASLSAG